jgi:flagellar protein FlaG
MIIMEPILASYPVTAVPPSGFGPSTIQVSGAAGATSSPSANAHAAPIEAPTPEQIKQAIEVANRALKSVTNNLEFALDPSTGKTVVSIIDAGTQEVIRQIPSEEMLAIARAVDHLQGTLLKAKA